MSGKRTIQVGLTVLGAITVMMFVSGIRASRESAAALQDRPHRPAEPVSSARSYRDMREDNLGPNRHMYDGAFARLQSAHPSVLEPAPVDEVERARSIERRMSRRAYDGAPPTIPHSVLQMEPPACLACHERGMRVANLVAPAMSHRRMDSCTQCHVVGSDPRPVAQTPPAPSSSFVGLATWGRGTRAWAGAPPTIPHPTLMRTTCESCHGVNGLAGLRTPHPWRESCSQCHVSAAAVDQRPVSPLSKPTASAP